MLSPGNRLGPYEILAALGAGGMGEVYRARDARLGRDVAIKILPDVFLADAERVERFQREARTLAALNHPNIAQIYGMEDRALVMELVEGEDLSAAIARGAVPLAEALPIARQIADALDAAHELGIIHRDLKPANIKIRRDGTVKVLDFGLAKALGPDPASGIGSASISPTMTARATQMGTIIGTAAYMAPEQARGKAVDRRADIWAFGAVLYEMLTGRRAFEGHEISDILASVLKDTPSLDALPAGTPASVRRLLCKCLEKDPRQRLRDIGDARIELNEPAANEADLRVLAPRRHRALMVLPWGLTAILAIALAASWVVRRPAPAPGGARYPVALPEGQRVGTTTWAPMAVSPDGSRLVYAGESGRLLVRSRNRIDSTDLAGTDGAFNPFFSPDGSRVGFMSGVAGNAQVRVVALDGGPPSLVTATAVGGPGASWGTDGFIYYDSSGVGPLRRVKETGGESVEVSTLAAGELQHNWPDALPGGRGVLITINRGGPGVNVSQSDDIGVIDLATGRTRMLVHGVLARYVSSGHIVYLTADAVLMAVPFDESRLELTGSAVALIEGVNIRMESGGIDVAVSRSGTLWYATGTRAGQQELLWFTSTGGFSPVEAGWTGAFKSLSLSPDGTKVALTITDGVEQQIWVKDLIRPRGSLSKITHERTNGVPRWHPDGTRLSYRSLMAGGGDLRSVRADGTGEPSVLARDLLVVDGGWTADGDWLVYGGLGPSTRVFREDIHGLRRGAAKPVALVASNYNERNGSVSRDGRWLVFDSNATGRMEVYVRPFPNTAAAQTTVSTGGGVRPRWSPDGTAIYYGSGTNELTRVPVVPGSSFAVGKPSALFSLAGVQDWDVAADGRIILIRAAEAARGGQLIVVEDFSEELRRKVPRAQ